MSLSKPEYKKRLIDETLKKYLNTFGAVSIEGPKWCGKTWTSLNQANTEYALDNDDIREVAIIDNDYVLDGKYPILIDEWNYVPKLWDKVRRKCDEDNLSGKYILTCSTTLSDEEERAKIHHSGAGRIARLQMYPMSLYESGDSNGSVSLDNMYNGKFQNKIVSKVSLQQLAKLIIRGGWPRNIDTDDYSLIPKEYIKSVLKKDINKTGKKTRSEVKMNMLLKSLARNESTLAGSTTLIKDIATYETGEELLSSRNTIDDYLDVLKRLYIIEDQEPYAFNFRSPSRIAKSPKRHFIDPSLACACLNINDQMLLSDLKTFGFMFESLVERDLKIYMNALGGHLYHFRDNVSGLEVDSILEFPNGEYAAVEIKLGYSEREAAKESLMKFYEYAPVKPKFMCIIYGVGEIVSKDKDKNIYTFPITELKI